MNFQPGWIMSTAATVKVFIDVMIGVWAFVLAWVWSAKFDRKEGTTVKAKEIWQRFPKFVLGYVATFLIGACSSVFWRPTVIVARCRVRWDRQTCSAASFLS